MLYVEQQERQGGGVLAASTGEKDGRACDARLSARKAIRCMNTRIYFYKERQQYV